VEDEMHEIHPSTKISSSEAENNIDKSMERCNYFDRAIPHVSKAWLK